MAPPGGSRRPPPALAEEEEEGAGAGEAPELDRQAWQAALASYEAFRARLRGDLEAASQQRRALVGEQREYEELAANIQMLQRVSGHVGRCCDEEAALPWGACGRGW